jgi:rhodanese-related sulfurtransferase
MTTLSPTEFHRQRSSGKKLLLIDVRSPAEFRAIHAEGATLLPLEQADADAVRRLQEGHDGVGVICKSGARASKAAQRLGEAGVDALCIEGGTDAWAAAGLPVVRGRSVMSIERQVRIAAGGLVLLGVALGLLVHPAFFGVSAFVGAGLVFAGITDTCGMGMLLARMPWNR